MPRRLKTQERNRGVPSLSIFMASHLSIIDSLGPLTSAHRLLSDSRDSQQERICLPDVNKAIKLGVNVSFQVTLPKSIWFGISSCRPNMACSVYDNCPRVQRLHIPIWYIVP